MAALGAQADTSYLKKDCNGVKAIVKKAKVAGIDICGIGLADEETKTVIAVVFDGMEYKLDVRQDNMGDSGWFIKMDDGITRNFGVRRQGKRLEEQVIDKSFVDDLKKAKVVYVKTYAASKYSDRDFTLARFETTEFRAIVEAFEQCVAEM